MTMGDSGVRFDDFLSTSLILSVKFMASSTIQRFELVLYATTRQLTRSQWDLQLRQLGAVLLSDHSQTWSATRCASVPMNSSICRRKHCQNALEALASL